MVLLRGGEPLSILWGWNRPDSACWTFWTGAGEDQRAEAALALAVNTWLLGKHGRPRFKGYRQLDTVEGKSNQAGLRWREGTVEWTGLTLPAILPSRDPVVSYALGCRVKYVRLVRRKLDGRDRFHVQLILEGFPYRKPKHQIGDGEVGLDIGPSTVAAVGKDQALLVPFCEAVVRKHRVIRRL